ncbi:MAG: DUF1016 N-terminal domain-containing protein [Prevotellaceae bacterium]|jgi:hypothetical protein|nr:DUF1016 N-terminal domain-containing protein [Prevotellaceae bacterium]
MAISQQHTFDNLIDNVYRTHCLMQQTAQKSVNQLLEIQNWITGYYIVEYEQNGYDRAKYGERLIDEMSRNLKMKGLKGYSPISLRTIRSFYRTYPQIQQSVTVELQKTSFETYKQLPFSNIQIQQSPTVESCEAYPIPNEVLLSHLTYTHFVELMRAKEPLERLFYEVETIKNNWTVKQLERAFDTGLYVRTGLSR